MTSESINVALNQLKVPPSSEFNAKHVSYDAGGLKWIWEGGGVQFRRWTHTAHYITTHHVVSGCNPTRLAHNHTLSKRSSIKQHYKIKKSSPPLRALPNDFL